MLQCSCSVCVFAKACSTFTMGYVHGATLQVSHTTSKVGKVVPCLSSLHEVNKVLLSFLFTLDGVAPLEHTRLQEIMCMWSFRTESYSML